MYDQGYDDDIWSYGHFSQPWMDRRPQPHTRPTCRPYNPSSATRIQFQPFPFLVFSPSPHHLI